MTDRFDVQKEMSKSDVGDSIEVILHRFSNNSGHFISYPEDATYFGDEDGIHVETTERLTGELSSILGYESVILHGRVEITEIDGYPLAELEALRHVAADHSSISQLKELKDEFANSDIISKDGKLSIKFPIRFEEQGEQQDEPVQSESQDVVHSGNSRSKRDLEATGSDKTLVYYVDTSNAECYHTTKHCSGLDKREGDIQKAVKTIGEPVPDPISDLRKCHRC